VIGGHEFGFTRNRPEANRSIVRERICTIREVGEGEEETHLGGHGSLPLLLRDLWDLGGQKDGVEEAGLP